MKNVVIQINDDNGQVLGLFSLELDELAEAPFVDQVPINQSITRAEIVVSLIETESE